MRKRVLVRAAGAWVLASGLAACAEAPSPPADEPTEGPLPAAELTAPIEAEAAEAEPAAIAEPDLPAEPASDEKRFGASPDPEEPGGDRVYAKSRFAWIQRAPASGKGWIGYLAAGGSVRVKGGDASAATTPGPGCDEWVAIEPVGYVCLGVDATLDPTEPEVRALLEDAPDLSSPWPFEYAESIGTPRYVDFPTEAQVRKEEWDLEAHRDKLARAASAGSPEEVEAIDEWIVGVDASLTGTAAPELTPFGPRVREARNRVVRGSTIAFTRAFDHDGRAWLLTSDKALVPRDRTRPFAKSEFEGVELGGDIELPIAFFRQETLRFQRQGDGFEPDDKPFPRHGWVMLTGETVEVEGAKFHATRGDAGWVREGDAPIATRNEELPFSPAELEKMGDDSTADGWGFTWLDIRILDGLLVAYEKREPVFVTLISPGRGGPPVPGIDPIETASTPVGMFRVDGKFRTATMVSSTDSTIVHAEVQYVQNFHGPHALHGAYWHDEWGKKKSGGCVNLSPKDSQRVFHWSEPRVPPGWHGLRSVSMFGPPTRVRVRP